jgi:hypothetical protein
MDNKPPQQEPIEYLVGLIIVSALFAFSSLLILFMYVDMASLKHENKILSAKVVKYRSESCQ